jgi:hypothetical protein
VSAFLADHFNQNLLEPVEESLDQFCLAIADRSDSSEVELVGPPIAVIRYLVRSYKFYVLTSFGSNGWFSTFALARWSFPSNSRSSLGTNVYRLVSLAL